MSIQNIQVGDTVPIELQIADGAINQYPQALVYDQGSSLLQTVDLAHDNQGNYSGTAYTMPDTEFVKVVYIVYSNIGHTELNDDYERDIEVFYRILPDEFKANVAALALEATAQTILADTDELQTNQGNWLTATGFAVPNEYDAVHAAMQADLDNPDQYKATGFAVPNEYDAVHTTMQADLDNPDQYKATGFAVPNEYDAAHAAIQLDLDTPDQYKATGFAVANEYDVPLAAIQAEVNGLDGAVMRGTDGANTTTPPTVVEIDAELTTQHDAGSWSGAGSAPTVGEINAELTGSHGTGSWQTGSGSAAPTVGEIDAQLTGTHGTGSWKESTGGMSEAELHSGLDSYSNKSGYQANVTNLDAAVSTRAVPNEYDARMTLIQADLDNPNQYKAIGFSVPAEYDARLAAIQLDLDNPNQYKATGFSVPNEYNAEIARLLNATEIKTASVAAAGATTTVFTTDLTETEDQFWLRNAIVFTSGQCRGQVRKIHAYSGATKQIHMYTPLAYAPANGDTFVIIATRNFRLNLDDVDLVVNDVDTELTTNHGTGSWIEATGFGLAGEYDARMTTVQESLTRILGLTQENQFIDTTVHAGENLVSARLRLYSDAASVGTDLNVTDTYTITASYTAAGMETYSMVKV